MGDKDRRDPVFFLIERAHVLAQLFLSLDAWSEASRRKVFLRKLFQFGAECADVRCEAAYEPEDGHPCTNCGCWPDRGDEHAATCDVGRRIKALLDAARGEGE